MTRPSTAKKPTVEALVLSELLLLSALLLAALGGCGTEARRGPSTGDGRQGGEQTDTGGGAPDTGRASDAGADAGSRDGGRFDAGADVGAETDGGGASDGGREPDAEDPADLARDSDAGGAVDLGGEPDSGAGVDGGGAVDTGGAHDVGGTSDAGVRTDAGGEPDAGAGHDAGGAADCACADGQRCQAGLCEDEPSCDDDCGEPWLATCSGDGFGTRLCVPDPEVPGCTVPSRRVPCGEGRSCAAGVCSGRCLAPEVLFLVDRSSSMSAGGRWDFTSSALLDVAERFGALARVGVRAFPGLADACAAAELSPPAFHNQQAFEHIPAPAQVAQTPIAAAFEGVLDAFGDPDEGEAVVLITDGDETCQQELAALAEVEVLRRRGVRTFAVGISQQANGELLGRIATAGGTAPGGGPGWHLVREAAELEAALAGVFTSLETCACLPEDTGCDGDTRLVCSALGDGLVPSERCAFGCRSGACFPVCRPGGDTVRCADAQRLACNATGDAFAPAEDCPWGCDEALGCLPPPTVGSCRYEAPLQVRAATGLDLALSALIHHAGVTDGSPATDPAPLVLVQLGYGPDGVPPDDAAWVWQAAAPDGAWDDLAGDLPGWDRYATTIPVPSEGDWDLAARASVSGGADWTACDRGPSGSDDGFASADAGQLVAVADALCTPGDWVCDGDTARRCGPGGVDFVEEQACDPLFGCAAGQGCRNIDYRFDIQRELPDAAMADWRVCHASRYDADGFPMDAIRAACDGNVLAVGCRRIGSPDWRLVAMGERDVVFSVTGDANEFDEHNGADWYYGPDSGIGFARSIGPEIVRHINGCDTEVRYGTYRMCWFTSGDVLGRGYRCGSDFSLDENPLWERRIWTVP